MPPVWYRIACGITLITPSRCTVEHNGRLSRKLSAELLNYPLGLLETSRIIPTSSDKSKNINNNTSDFLVRLMTFDRVWLVRPIAQIRKILQKIFEDIDRDISVIKRVKGHYNHVMTESHFVDNLPDPQHTGGGGGENELYPEELTKSRNTHRLENYPDTISSIVNYKVKTEPFHPYMFCSGAWNSQSESLTDTLIVLINQLLNVASSSVRGWQCAFHVWTSSFQVS